MTNAEWTAYRLRNEKFIEDGQEALDRLAAQYCAEMGARRRRWFNRVLAAFGLTA